MKTNPLLLVVASFASVSALLAAPLSSTTAVHTKPDDTAPAITVLKAGTEPVAAPDTVASTPAGWMAVEVPGPFDGYVQEKDLTKSLDMKPGVTIRLAPEANAGVLAIAEKDDKTNITGQHGRWLQIRLERKLVGYIRIGGTPGYLPPIATTPAGGLPVPAPMSPAPVAPAAYGSATPGQAATAVGFGDSTGALARQFAGKFVSTRSPFHPRRPYDWALNDDADKRYAYLDVSKLLQTEQIESFAGHNVVVFGAVRATADGKDLVVVVESLQLK